MKYFGPLKNERKVYLEQIPQPDNATLRKVKSICLWYFLLILWKKTRHTGDFQRFHFETVHKLFSITVIPLFSHSGQCHDSTQIEFFNLLCSSKPFPLCLFVIPSPPELSCERKSSCLSSDFRLPSLLRLFSQTPKYQLWLGNLEARNSSKNDKRKISKDIDY